MRLEASSGSHQSGRLRVVALVALFMAFGTGRATAQVQFSPDEKFAVQSTPDGIRLYDLATGAKQWFQPKLTDEERQAESRRTGGQVSFAGPLAFSPNGDRVIGAGSGGRVFLLDFPGGDVVKVFSVTGETTALTFLSNGVGFLRGTKDGALELYDLATWKLSHTLLRKGEGPVLSIDCSPDSKSALTSGYCEDVRLWNLLKPDDKPRVLVPFVPKGISTWGIAARFTSDGMSAVVAGGGEYLRVFDVATGKTRRTINPEDAQKESCVGVAVLMGGQRALTGDSGAIRLLDLGTGKTVQTLTTTKHQSPDWVAVSRSGTLALSLTRAGRLVLWDLGGKESPRVLDTGVVPRGKRRWYTAVAFADPNRVLVGDVSGRLALHDAATGRLVSVLLKSGDPIHALVVTQDGQVAVSASRNDLGNKSGALAIWDLKGGRLVRQWEQKPGGFTAVAVSADGKLAAGGTDEGQLRVVELPGGKEVKFARPRAGRIDGLAFAPGKDGAELVVADHSREGGAVYDAETLTHRRDFAVRPGGPVWLTPDGAAAVVGGRDLRVYDARDGRLLRTLAYGGARWLGEIEARKNDSVGPVFQAGDDLHFGAVALSPDGKFVLACEPSNRLRLWKVGDSVPVRTFATGWARERIWCVGFSPDSRRAVTAGEGSSLHIWDVETGKLVRELDAQDP